MYARLVIALRKGGDEQLSKRGIVHGPYDGLFMQEVQRVHANDAIECLKSEKGKVIMYV